MAKAKPRKKPAKRARAKRAPVALPVAEVIAEVDPGVNPPPVSKLTLKDEGGRSVGQIIFDAAQSAWKFAKGD